MAVEEVGIKLNLQGRADTAKGLRDTDADIAKLGTTAEASGSKLSRGLGAVEAGGRKVAAGVKIAAGAVGASAVAAATSLAVVGVGYNTLEQNSRAALTTLLGSRDAANRMMNDVREFGKTSPFPRQAFISATTQLLGFGFQAKSIIPTLKTINDTTAALGGNAQTVATLSDVFASIKAQGKLSGDQVQRLAAIGVDSIDILTKASGKNREQVQKAISAGSIQADDAIAVLTNGMNRRFGGAADNLKATWSGATDRVKGAWRDLGSDLVAPFVNPNGGGYAVTWANKVADRLRVVQAAVPGVFAKMATGAAAARNGGTGQLASAWERLGFYAERAALWVQHVDWAGIMRKITGGASTGGVLAFLHNLTSDGPAARAQLHSIGDSVGKLGPVFSALGDAAPSLTTVLKLTAGALAFLARHADTLAVIIPVLVGGYIAYRATLGATTLVAKTLRAEQLLGTLNTWRQIGATRANAAATRLLAIEMMRARGATEEEIAATNRGALANARAALRAGAMRTATLAQTAAVKLARGAQWLWNAAISANPIGLVIVGVIALAAAAIYAYKHFGWFRTAVNATWGALKTAGKWLWNTVVPFTPLGLAIRGGIALVKEIKRHWSDFTDVLKTGAKWLGKVTDVIGIKGITTVVAKAFGGGDDGGDGGPPRRATGGPAKAGRSYIVGEDRPELFEPTTDGVIRPRVPAQGETARVDARVSLPGGAGGGGDLHVHIDLDGHEVGTAVLRDFRGRMARQ